MLMRIVVVSTDAEVETRCASGVPCGLYTERMGRSARERAAGNEDRASALILAARWHRLLALHPELGDDSA
jgi:hypothetical protein